MKEAICKLCPEKDCYRTWPEGRMVVVGKEKHPRYTIFTNIDIEDCNERIIYKALGENENPLSAHRP